MMPLLSSYREYNSKLLHDPSVYDMRLFLFPDYADSFRPFLANRIRGFSCVSFVGPDDPVLTLLINVEHCTSMSINFVDDTQI